MKQSWYKPDIQLQVRIFLTIFLLAVVYVLFLAFMFKLGVPAGILFFVALLMLGAQYFFSDQLVLLSAGAFTIERDQFPELYDMVARLAQQADLPMPKVAVMYSRVPSAFATGRDQHHAVIAVTRMLLDLLTPSELEAVLAHELTHIRNRDVAVMTVASFFALLAENICIFIEDVASVLREILGYHAYDIPDNDDIKDIIGYIFYVWLASFLVWLVSSLLLGAFSRYREYAADRGAALLTGSPSALASALLKIDEAMRRVPKRDLRETEGVSAFFIVPAGPRSRSQNRLAKLVSTHPPLEKRLAYLERLQQEMAQ